MAAVASLVEPALAFEGLEFGEPAPRPEIAALLEPLARSEPFEVDESVVDACRPDDACEGFDVPDDELAPPADPAEPVVSA